MPGKEAQGFTQSWLDMVRPEMHFILHRHVRMEAVQQKAMELAMQEAETEPDQVGYINAHGTGTHHNDLFETRAIKRAFGEAAKQVAVNSTKSMIGHLLGAAGAVEAIVCVKTLQEGFIHQTVGTKETDAECDLDYTIGAPKQKKLVTQ